MRMKIKRILKNILSGRFCYRHKTKKPDEVHDKSILDKYYKHRRATESDASKTHPIHQDKGKTGEAMVNAKLLYELDRYDYVLHRDITLLYQDGTTQIDHILISKFGVFVIETKSYSGWIFGNETEKQWTQKLSRNNSVKFQNPIHQNYKHVLAIRELFELDNEVHSLVVFAGKGLLKSPAMKDVTEIKNLIETVKNREKTLLSARQMIKLSQRLDIAKLEKSEKVNSIHNEYITSIIKQKNRNNEHQKKR